MAEVAIQTGNIPMLETLSHLAICAGADYVRHDGMVSNQARNYS